MIIYWSGWIFRNYLIRPRIVLINHPYHCPWFIGCSPLEEFQFLRLHFLSILKKTTYVWLCWAFVAVHQLSLQRAGAALRVQRAGFSSWSSPCMEHRLLAWGLSWLWQVSAVVAGCGLQSTGSVVVVHRLGCPVACGISPDQGSSLSPLQWQVGSSSLGHQGSVFILFWNHL